MSGQPKNTTLVVFFDRLEMAAKKAGYESQQSLADACGVTQAAVSKWKKKGVIPDTDVIIKLCTALKISSDALLGINFGGAERDPIQHRQDLNIATNPAACPRCSAAEARAEQAENKLRTSKKTAPDKNTIAKLRQLVKELDETLKALES